VSRSCSSASSPGSPQWSRPSWPAGSSSGEDPAPHRARPAARSVWSCQLDLIRPNSVLGELRPVGANKPLLLECLVNAEILRRFAWSTWVLDGGTIIPSTACISPGRWHVSFRSFVRGAGGNRTPVHQPVIEPATTIPGIATDAVTPTGRLSARGGPRSVFPESQRSFSPSAVFPAVIPHFCCRAVMEWPRATFLLTMTLHSPENQAVRVNCSSAILVVAPFSESEQLGSQTRTALLTSKPVSPVIDM